MKYVLLLAVLFVGAFTASAQSEAYIGYSFLRENVKVERPELVYNEDFDSHGVVASYTRYKGPVGLTGEAAANFNSGAMRLGTLAGGLTLKSHGERFQPFVKGLVGVGRQNVTEANWRDNSEVALAWIAGAGLDVNVSKGGDTKLRFGADYVQTRFAGAPQHNARLTTGIVF